MNKPKRHTITAALPYGNGPIHIGHLAGAYLPADIYVRFLKLKGEDVLFICGLDEHGVPITIKAAKEGISPQALVDRYHQNMSESFEKFGIHFDIFDRTTNETHHRTAQDFFTKLHEKGCFIEETAAQFYDAKAKTFLADRYIIGTCPHCGHTEAYGDQCEKCGSSLSPKELINPKSALTGNAPELKETTHWYLPLDQYEDWLKKWILEEHQDWKSNVYGQCKSWLDQGLKPRAITRDLNWGVPVPLENAKGKVLYVWFDAPIGYISATKNWAKKKAAQHPETHQATDWEKYWKDKDTRLVHFIGKDNIVFHCIIFPSMLKAEGSYILPEQVPANEFLNLEGQKLSTSRNWAVWLHEYLADFPDLQDSLRYTLTANMPETKDNEFTWKDLQSKNNNELLAILGNFVNRVVVLIHKYYGGVVPEVNEDMENSFPDLAKLIAETPDKIEKSLMQFKYREALGHAMQLARSGNKFLTTHEPWKKQKTAPKEVELLLTTAIQVIANLKIVITPFLPFTAEKLAAIFPEHEFGWEDAGKSKLIAGGTSIAKPGYLFRKIEDKEIEQQVEKLKKQAAKTKAMNASESTPDITFEDFMKVKLKTGIIESAQKVPKSNKLLELKVKMSEEETRTIVSGIAKFYKAEDIIGQQIVVVANLAPKKIFGIESHGMILMAEDADGRLAFVAPDKAIAAGSEVR